MPIVVNTLREARLWAADIRRTAEAEQRSRRRLAELQQQIRPVTTASGDRRGCGCACDVAVFGHVDCPLSLFRRPPGR